MPAPAPPGLADELAAARVAARGNLCVLERLVAVGSEKFLLWRGMAWVRQPTPALATNRFGLQPWRDSARTTRRRAASAACLIGWHIRPRQLMHC